MMGRKPRHRNTVLRENVLVGRYIGRESGRIDRKEHGAAHFVNRRSADRGLAHTGHPRPREHAAGDAFSIAGGGDTLAAIAKYGIEKDVDYISTGGGAFLEVLEGKTLPAFEILAQRAAQ